MKRAPGRFWATLSLLAGTWATVALVESREPEPLERPLDHIAMRIGDWVGTNDPAPNDTVLKSLGASSHLSRTYRQGARHLNLFIAFYANQRAGETMHSPKHCLPGGGWEILEPAEIGVVVDGRQVRINKYLVSNGAQRMLMLYWYQSRDRIIASEYLGKAYLFWDTVSRGHVSGSIVRLGLPDEPWALEAGAAFAASLIPQMRECLGS